MRLQYNKNAKNPVYSLLNQLTIISLKNVLIEFLKIQEISDDNYIPGFTKTDLTASLQEAFGFAPLDSYDLRLDTEVIDKRKRIVQKIRKKYTVNLLIFQHFQPFFTFPTVKLGILYNYYNNV